MKTFWLALLAVFAAATIGLTDAEAKRVGGGKSIGKQAPSNVMQRDATPSAPAGAGASSAAPAAPAAAAAPRAGAPAAGAAAAGGNRWLGPVAGLAAGLGLAALASHLGFGEELASFMMIAIFAIIALVVIRMIMARRAAPQMQQRTAYAGAGYGTTGLGQEASVPNYTPVSTPAASRDLPMDTVRQAAQPVTGWQAPEGFDTEGFVRNAKVQFVRLQAAFDAGDSNDLREFTSPEMFAELKLEIDERNGGSNQTDVVTLDAGLLGVETGATEYMASVRFTGMLREQANAAAEPFDEVWNFTRPVSGPGGWVLGGIQQLSKA